MPAEPVRPTIVESPGIPPQQHYIRRPESGTLSPQEAAQVSIMRTREVESTRQKKDTQRAVLTSETVSFTPAEDQMRMEGEKETETLFDDIFRNTGVSRRRAEVFYVPAQKAPEVMRQTTGHQDVQGILPGGFSLPETGLGAVFVEEDTAKRNMLDDVMDRAHELSHLLAFGGKVVVNRWLQPQESGDYKVARRGVMCGFALYETTEDGRRQLQLGNALDNGMSVWDTVELYQRLQANPAFQQEIARRKGFINSPLFQQLQSMINLGQSHPLTAEEMEPFVYFNPRRNSYDLNSLNLDSYLLVRDVAQALGGNADPTLPDAEKIARGHAVLRSARLRNPKDGYRRMADVFKETPGLTRQVLSLFTIEQDVPRFVGVSLQIEDVISRQGRP